MRVKRGPGQFLFGGILCLPVIALGLDVRPEFFQFTGVPGARLKADITLVNESAEPVDVRLNLEKVGGPGQTPWITVSPEKMRILGGKTRLARLKVRVPRDGGERTAQVWARAQGPLASSELRLVRKVNLIIQGTERYALSIVSVQTVVRGDVLEVATHYRNDGNVTLHPTLEAEAALSGGDLGTAREDGRGPSLAPGETGSVRVAVPLSGRGWDGRGTVRAFYRDSNGDVRRVERAMEK